MKQSNALRYKIVDQESERFGQVGVYDRQWLIPGSKPDLHCHTITFADGKTEQFLSYQIEKAPRKILFLDIDGVCNSEKFAVVSNNRGVLGIDPYAAFLVGKIQLDTGCEVVLSSTWRLWEQGREDVRKQVVDFVDVTPELNGWRGEEIEAWLAENPDVTRYAILDDDMDMLAYQAPNFFKTRFAEGLTPEIAKAVTEHLNS